MYSQWVLIKYFHSGQFQSFKGQKLLQPWWMYSQWDLIKYFHSGAFQSSKSQHFLQPWWIYSLWDLIKNFHSEAFKSSGSQKKLSTIVNVFTIRSHKILSFWGISELQKWKFSLWDLIKNFHSQAFKSSGSQKKFQP